MAQGMNDLHNCALPKEPYEALIGRNPARVSRIPVYGEFPKMKRPQHRPQTGGRSLSGHPQKESPIYRYSHMARGEYPRPDYQPQNRSESLTAATDPKAPGSKATERMDTVLFTVIPCSGPVESYEAWDLWPEHQLI